jgi:ribonuclease J
LQVVPLGGLGEIGKNMTAVRQASGMILVDAGMSFPDEEMPGIDLVLPDFTFLRQHSDELKGIVLTHAHEDHVGALPYILREFNVPVYGTRLTLGLVRSKLQEFGIKKGDLREIKAGDTQNLGGFGLEFINVNHSIPDAVAIAIRTNAGLIVFSGDYKVDLTPIEGAPMDLGRLAELGNEGVLAFFGDSTNSERPGYVPSERIVQKTLEDIFERATGRIIVASFASHIHRVSQVVEAAKKHNRLVGVAGRSMVRNVGIARELGYLDLPKEMMVEARDMSRIPDSDIAVLMTGSQGEPLAALSRVAAGTHRSIEIGRGDTVVISAHPIPGNERGVSRTINNLMKKGADVHYSPRDRRRLLQRDARAPAALGGRHVHSGGARERPERPAPGPPGRDLARLREPPRGERHHGAVHRHRPAYPGADRQPPGHRPRGAQERHPEGPLRLPLGQDGQAPDHPPANSRGLNVDLYYMVR